MLNVVNMRVLTCRQKPRPLIADTLCDSLCAPVNASMRTFVCVYRSVDQPGACASCC